MADSKQVGSFKLSLKVGRVLEVGLLLLFISVGLRLWLSSTLAGNDDLSVADCSLDLLNGGFSLPFSHYCARFGITLPMAVVFSIAGTGAWQISVIPALASLGSLLCAFIIGLTFFDLEVAISAALAFALFPLDVEHFGLAYPDALQGLAISATIVLLALSKRNPHFRWPLSIASGLFWTWAYLIKIDAVIAAPIILIMGIMSYAAFRDTVVCCATMAIGVCAEMFIYWVYTGDPLRHIHLDSNASNELLAVGRDYRDFFIFPRAMFVLPYETGIHYFFWIAATIFGLIKRSKPVIFLAVWTIIWQLWLLFGGDPFSGFKLKAQLVRYLLSWQIPMCVLVGWLINECRLRLRFVAPAAIAAMLAIAVILGAFNQLSYKAAEATKTAVSAALDEGWFPLYPDLQSFKIVKLLLHDRPEARSIHEIQQHNFATGMTKFLPPVNSRVFILENTAYARELAIRNFVKRIDIGAFDRPYELVYESRRPMSDFNYSSMFLLGWIADSFFPEQTRAKIRTTITEIVRPGDVRIYRLDPSAK